MKNKCISVGGQALIEGVMMKSPTAMAMAVRGPEGNIQIEDIAEKHLRDKVKFLGWPVLRGLVNYIESMISGYKALMRSAELSGMTDLEEDTPKEQKDGKKTSALVSVIMVVASVLGVAIALFLFMWLPTAVFNGVNHLAGGQLSLYRSIIEGVLKLVIFIVYLALTSQMSEIKRLFMYHGAEHKTIFCFEAGLPLTVENAKKMRRFHPRCGTSFLLIMIVVSMLVNMALYLIFPALTKLSVVWALVKVLMIPLICGLGYELLKICGKYNNIFTKIISAPGLWIQRITTKEPEEDMLEVAITALKAVLPEYKEEVATLYANESTADATGEPAQNG